MTSRARPVISGGLISENHALRQAQLCVRASRSPRAWAAIFVDAHVAGRGTRRQPRSRRVDRVRATNYHRFALGQ